MVSLLNKGSFKGLSHISPEADDFSVTCASYFDVLNFRDYELKVKFTGKLK